MSSTSTNTQAAVGTRISKGIGHRVEAADPGDLRVLDLRASQLKPGERSVVVHPVCQRVHPEPFFLPKGFLVFLIFRWLTNGEQPA
jgi:hypothetical protein